MQLAASVLCGRGLEIGALDQPLEVPASVEIRYVDRLPVSELIHHYPEIGPDRFVEVDLTENGETLGSVPSSSEDFVIACHLLEHCENPIAALAAWVRVVQPGGIVFLAVPNRDLNFDRKRPATSWSHVHRDWADGPEWSRRAHYREWVELVEATPREEVQRRACELEETRYSIHFHVWTPPGLRRFLINTAGVLDYAFSLSAFVRNGDETLVVLQVES